MTTESLEELRQRLLGNEGVREMIRARAYEIYRMRGVQPGSAAQDWLEAENEVLVFLLAHQPEHIAEAKDEQITASSTLETSTETATPKKRKPRLMSSSTTRESAAKKGSTKRSKSTKAAGSDPKPKRTRKKSISEDKTT